ncbi:hypothetical protein F4778DRAFT_734604 [Xylariomycetidae sp. FL2044]|nr:hypothetical protein F4778DRAFT_734604 [Xylariomycetidae sp. FL2044]
MQFCGMASFHWLSVCTCLNLTGRTTNVHMYIPQVMEISWELRCQRASITCFDPSTARAASRQEPKTLHHTQPTPTYLGGLPVLSHALVQIPVVRCPRCMVVLCLQSSLILHIAQIPPNGWQRL